MRLLYEELEISEEMMDDTATRVVGVLTLVATGLAGAGIGIALT